MTKRLRLGELLLSRGICSRERLREAWEQKVVYGDRLGTNLLAVGVIDERTLGQALGHQHGVHSGHGKVLKIDPGALKLVPRNLAEQRFVVPHHVVDKTLYLLMRDPHDAAINFMPLQSADPFGGIIITEWYSAPEDPNEQMKVTVYILDKRLRADGLKVSVFRQIRATSGWVDSQVNPETSTKLENAILSRARQLRLATLEN